jgi:signal transduction histidine kinase/CheY-like chemotaxis protein
MALLRILPASVFEYLWTMPSAYADADVVVINSQGNYVSNTRLSGYANFYEYIKNFNNISNDDLEVYKEGVNGDGPGYDMYNFENDEQMLIVHSRINTGGNDWQLISYIPVGSLDKAQFNSKIVWYVLNAVLVLFILDIWHLAEINRQLKKSIKETKEANEAKTRFLSTMSHDIRTPMNAIIGMTAIAGKDAGNKEHVESCLEKISLSSKHLLTLINDILDISKIESGKYAVNPIEFSLDDLLENIFNVVRQNIKAKDLELKVNTQGIVHKRLFADQLRLNQIYINILSNAVKYTNEGGKITVDIIQSPSDVIPDGVKMVYRVKDTGIGMSKEFMEKMYDSFSRECDGRINTVQGTGLGLAITKQLVDLLGGTIEVESKLGKGSTFTVTLDMETAAIEEAADTEDNGGTGYDLTDFNILIAEDNDLNYEIAESMLEDEGAACTRAENGKVCVDILEKNDSQKFDLVLMDIQMPVMKGIDAAKLIRASENEDVKNIPIIAMTADAFAENIAECRDAGMDGHIAKPIDMALVLSEIQKVMKKHAHN